MEYKCDFCGSKQVDVCNVCGASVCASHIAETWIGQKTKLEWFICKNCFETANLGLNGIHRKFEEQLSMMNLLKKMRRRRKNDR